MKPKINFKESEGKLLIKIYLNSSKAGRGTYDTGISINSDLWDDERQTCGDPDVNIWMITTRETLQKNFRPDMNPKRLWMSFINNQSQTSATIRDAFEYRLANTQLKPNSRSVYQSVINSLMKAGIYDTPLTEVTPAFLRQYMNSLKVQDSSKFNTFVRIKGAIVTYVRDHRLNIDVEFSGIIKKPKYIPKENEWLTLSEVETLWNADLKWAKKDARDLFVLCCYTGMSMSDALAFNPQKNIKEINGRDFIVFNRIKTDSQCKVPVISQAKAIIDSRSWPVVMNRRSYQYHVSNTLGKIVGKKLHTHMARKTMGSLFLEFGFSIETVSKLLGHSNTSLTSKVYAVVTQAKVERELAEIGI